MVCPHPQGRANPMDGFPGTGAAAGPQHGPGCSQCLHSYTRETCGEGSSQSLHRGKGKCLEHPRDCSPTPRMQEYQFRTWENEGFVQAGMPDYMASLNKIKSQFLQWKKKKKIRLFICFFITEHIYNWWQSSSRAVFLYTKQTWNRAGKYPGLLHCAFMFRALSLPES